MRRRVASTKAPHRSPVVKSESVNSTNYNIADGLEGLKESYPFRDEFSQPYAGRAAEQLGMPAYDKIAEWDFGTRCDVLKRCHQVWERNPLAHTAVAYTRRYAVGKGMKVSYKSIEVKEILENFLKENHVDTVEKEVCDALQLDGEIFFRFFVKNGKTRLTTVEPWLVKDIHYSNGNPETYELTDGELLSEKDVLHVPINKMSYEKRGRPELFRVLPWLKAYRDWLENRARRNRYMALMYDVTVKNATGAQIKAKRSQYAEPPPPASLAIHNENEEWKILSGGIDASSVSEDGRAIKNMAIAGLGLPEFMFCYSSDTEVLTNRGWLLHKDVTLDDSVLCYDTTSGVLEWQQPIANNHFMYIGDMVSIKHKRCDILVTPNHKMWLRYQRDRSNNGKSLAYHEVIADDLLIHDPEYFCLTSGFVDETVDDVETMHLPECIGAMKKYDSVLMDDWIQFVAWIITDGFVTRNKDYGLGISQKIEHKHEIEKLLARLPFHFSKTVRDGDKWEWEMNSKQVHEWFCKNVGQGAANKRLPKEFLSLSVRQSRILLQTLIDGDGNRGFWKGKWSGSKSYGEYRTVSRMLADDVQALVLRCGFSAFLYFHSNMWVVAISERTEVSMSRKNISTVPYNDNVYCLTVPSGFYVTRRNGMVAIQGNSDGSNSNLASATAQTYPPLLKFEDYQDVLITAWRDILRRVVQNMVDAGLITEEVVTVDADGDPVTDPATNEPRMVKATEAFGADYAKITTDSPLETTQALQLQKANGWVDDETAIGQLGYDPAVIKKKLLTQNAEQQALQMDLMKQQAEQQAEIDKMLAPPTPPAPTQTSGEQPAEKPTEQTSPVQDVLAGIDDALAQGLLTQDQADEIKALIDAGEIDKATELLSKALNVKESLVFPLVVRVIRGDE